MILKLLACLTVVCATTVPARAADSIFVPGAFNGTWTFRFFDPQLQTDTTDFIQISDASGAALINTLGDSSFNQKYCPPATEKREYYRGFDEVGEIGYGCTNGASFVFRTMDFAILQVNVTNTAPPASFSGSVGPDDGVPFPITFTYASGGITTPLAQISRDQVAFDGTQPPIGLTLLPGTLQNLIASLRYQLVSAPGNLRVLLYDGAQLLASSSTVPVPANQPVAKSDITLTGVLIPNTAALTLRAELSLASGALAAFSETAYNVLQSFPVTAAPTLLREQRNTGAGAFSSGVQLTASGQTPVPFIASVVNNSSWLSLAAANGVINGTLRLGVNFSSANLSPGFYSDSIQIAAASRTIVVPVALTITDPEPTLTVDPDGVYFETREGQGSVGLRRVRLSALNGPVAWTAEILSGANIVQINALNGVSSPSAPFDIQVTLSPTATSIPGTSYAVIKVFTDDQTPQLVTVVSNVLPTTEPVTPQLSLASLAFIGVQGGANPAQARILVGVSQLIPVPFTVSITGGNWLTAVTSPGTASSSNSGGINVNTSTAGLAPGVYTAAVNVTIGAVTRTARVILIVQPVGTQMSPGRREATGCTPTRVIVAEIRLPDSFSLPAGWPHDLAARLFDDCGTALAGGTVLASLDNGDQPFRFSNDGVNSNYFANWQPGAGLLSAIKVKLTGYFGTLTPGIVEIQGNINVNSKAPPALLESGVVHNLNPVIGGPFAPGTVVQIYGRNLASAAESTPAPLPAFYKGTQIIVEGSVAPLYYLRSDVVVVHLPVTMSPGRSHAVFAVVNGAYSAPIMIDVVPARPGVATYAGGRLIAQHLDYTLVTEEKPAKPGESLVMYLVGMGTTNPPVAAGAFTPLALVPVDEPAEVTIDGQPVQIQYAGLTPTAIGLYQINFVVPLTARSADLDVVITQNGTPANASKLVVRK